MASDPRETILARMAVVLAGIDGVLSFERNATEISDAHCPAIVLNEGDETADDGDPIGRPANSVRRVYMEPQVLLAVIDDREDVGTELNAMRSKIITALINDATLIGLTADNTGARYSSMSSDLAIGRKMSGQMALGFSLAYYLKP